LAAVVYVRRPASFPKGQVLGWLNVRYPALQYLGKILLPVNLSIVYPR
jgi:hypothetical protein